MSRITCQGFHYSFDPGACQTCYSTCCRGESGYIWVSHSDLRPIADFLNITVIDLIQDKLVTIENRYSIRERTVDGEHYCLFLNPGSGCSIYPVRPDQCRSYPFWERFKMDSDPLLKECPGVNLTLSINLQQK